MTTTTAKALSPKQLAFVDEYMKDRNATRAYIRAGYSAKGAQPSSAKLLSNPMVATEVARRLEEYSRTAGITTLNLLLELKKIAFSDIRQAFNADGSLKNPVQLDDAAAGAIAAIKIVEIAGEVEVNEDTSRCAPTRFTKEVKLWDKVAAIFKLLEYFRDLPPPASMRNATNIHINADQAIVNLRSL